MKTPSYVSFQANQRLIGLPAKNIIERNPEKTIYDIKRMIGREYSDNNLQKDMKFWPFKVINKSNQPLIQIDINEETNFFLPQQISAMIFAHLKKIAEEHTG